MSDQPTVVTVKRIESADDPVIRCRITLEVDPADQKAVKRLARVVRELIPKEERAQFVKDFQQAAAEAGFTVPTSTRT